MPTFSKHAMLKVLVLKIRGIVCLIADNILYYLKIYRSQRNYKIFESTLMNDLIDVFSKVATF